MRYKVAWDEAETRLLPNDPEGLSKTFVDEKLGAKHLHIHVSVVGPKSRVHPPHKHEGEEAYYVLEGVGEVTVKEETYRVETDSSVFVPPGEPHGIQNIGNTTLRYMVINCRY